jgi:hypothetical protein
MTFPIEIHFSHVYKEVMTLCHWDFYPSYSLFHLECVKRALILDPFYELESQLEPFSKDLRERLIIKIDQALEEGRIEGNLLQEFFSHKSDEESIWKDFPFFCYRKEITQ